MKINNVELDIDFTDADLIESIEKNREKLIEACDNIDLNNLTPAEGIRQMCKVIKDFFDCVFGEGTSKKLFGEKNSYKLCSEAFTELIKARDQQFKEVEDTLNNYSPDRLKR